MTKHTEDFQPVAYGAYGAGRRYYTEADIDRIITTCPTGLSETMVDFPRATSGGGEPVLVPTDRKTVLAIKLEDIAASYFRSRNCQEEPSPSETVRQLHAIEAAGRNLLDALGVPESGSPDDIPTHILFRLRQCAGRRGARTGEFFQSTPIKRTLLDPNAPAAVRDAIQGVQYLVQCSADAKAEAEQEVRPDGKRNTGDQSMRALFGDLICIYIEIFDQEIRTSVGAAGSNREGQAGGPMIRFIQACIEPLGLRLSTHAIRERIKPIQRELRRMVKSMQQEI
jgi:hypothetical protein